MSQPVRRGLDDLHPLARPVFNDFLARLIEAQLPVMLIETGRTQQRQDELWAIGRTDGQPSTAQVTWTLDSRHIMKPSQGNKSLAIDVCLYDVYTADPGGDKLKWDTNHPGWGKIGAIGQACGLKWGVTDAKGNRKDQGHFEYIGPLT